MCLGIPAKIIEIDPATGQGRIDYLGTRVKTNFMLIDQARVGDWVIVHAGFAISRLDEEEARETLDLVREYLDSTES